MPVDVCGDSTRRRFDLTHRVLLCAIVILILLSYIIETIVTFTLPASWYTHNNFDFYYFLLCRALHIHFQFTGLVVLAIVTLVLFTLRHRLASLADEFKRFGDDRVTCPEHIEALFATFYQLLLTINGVNEELRIHRITLLVGFAFLVCVYSALVVVGAGIAWTVALAVAIQMPAYVAILWLLTYPILTIKADLEEIKQSIYVSSHLWSPPSAYGLALSRRYESLAEIVTRKLSVWGVDVLLGPLAGMVSIIGAGYWTLYSSFTWLDLNFNPNSTIASLSRCLAALKPH